MAPRCALAPHKITYKAHVTHPVLCTHYGFEEGVLTVARHSTNTIRLSFINSHLLKQQPIRFTLGVLSGSKEMYQCLNRQLD